MNERKPVRSMEYFAIKLIIAYLLISLIFYLTLTVVTYDVVMTLLYCLVNFLFLWLGYHVVKKKEDYHGIPELAASKTIGMLLFCSLSTIVISINNIASFYTSLEQCLEYILKPGKAYEYVKFQNRNGLVETTELSSRYGVLLTTLSFTKYYFASVSIMEWKKLKKIRPLLVITAIIYVAHSFLIGAMVNIGTLAISLLPAVYKSYSLAPTPAGKKRIRRYLTLASLIILLVLIYFMGSRRVFMVSNSYAHPILSGIIGMVFYIGHGYIGLSQCMRLPFVFTYGYTSLYGLSQKIAPLTGIDNLFNSSYLMRNELNGGQDALQVWSTIFPWLASDMTFYLIPLLMFLVGYFLRVLWRESLYGNNKYASILCGQILILCFMIPANNQLLHTYGNATSFLIIFILYARERSRLIILGKRLQKG